ncbi:IclR family transcriptional regulator [Streptomyces rimosus]|uniref:IclR family transcriptional regulator n=1 Tax=Streptomyces rimosus TaxID=1927 RepID=UPI0004C864E7|nr:IclR family transcriptional regulator C-terminal domain-containing protein [Streptomyces rimosus]
MYRSNTATAVRWNGSPPAPSTAGAPRRGVLAGAFALLSVLRQIEDASLTALASASGLPKTTAYRLLEQLSDLGAVEHRQGRYRIGPHLFQLGQGWQPCPELRPAARRPSRRLASVTGTTVGLAVLYQGQTMILDWTTGLDTTPPPVNDRSLWPWYTAAGKVLLAISRSELPFAPLPDTWPDEAAAIRRRGAAFDREEVLEGVCCTAVPVLGRSGLPVAALCVLTDPQHRLDRLTEAARRTATAIGAALGHRR